jgi:hypothetical protein
MEFSETVGVAIGLCNHGLLKAVIKQLMKGSNRVFSYLKGLVPTSKP